MTGALQAFVFDDHMSRQTLDEIRNATNKGRVPGDAEFQQQVEEATGRATSSRQRGSDRKSEKFWKETLAFLEKS